jgi:hypothetical protein
VLLARRDQHNQRMYRDVSRLTMELEQARAALSAGFFGRVRYFARLARRALRRVGRR